MAVFRITLAVAALVTASVPAAACEVGFSPDRQEMKELAAVVFAQDAKEEIDNLIICLADPDPMIRDDAAFTLWSEGFRGKHVSPDLMRYAMQRLSAILAGSDDAPGFRRPFAALALAEVARADRIEPYLTESELHELAEAGAAYLRGVRDYRGFVAGEGWRHGVAHGADLMLQLALNPRLSRTDADLLLGAIAAQVAPAGPVYYIHGEPGRLAGPILYLAKRADIDDAVLATWFQSLRPGDSPRWKDAYASDAGLAAVHNSTAFAVAIYVSASESQDPQIRRLAPLAVALIKALP